MEINVELFISCRKLRDLDLLSKSDPVCVLYTKNNSADTVWSKVGSTERQNNNLNPDFQRSFTIKFCFERKQPIKFEVIDDDGNGSFDMIGSTETTLGTIMGTKGQTFLAELQVPNKKGSRGKIVVRADSIKDSNWEAQMKINGMNLPNNAVCFCLDNNNTAIEISRASED